uniref:Uncharacterized protein n=1 Tax=Romanomermis culicivorax TaxID=13658 RepID=A0A915I8M2_ROMCU
MKDKKNNVPSFLMEIQEFNEKQAVHKSVFLKDPFASEGSPSLLTFFRKRALLPVHDSSHWFLQGALCLRP